MKLKQNLSLLLIFTCLITIYQTKAQCDIDDWTALKAFYENTTEDNWKRVNGWAATFTNQTEPPTDCNLEDLQGISLNSEGRVKGINLNRNNLKGSLPPEIGNLIELEYITLFENQLNGSLPLEIGNLTKLYSLKLADNEISGGIPVELSNLINLETLDLRNNQLNGNVPPELGNLSNLVRLDLHLNQLNGSIPPELGNLAKLTYLSISSNQISGSIPNGLGNLTNLTALKLSDNQLIGSIPTELGNLVKLKVLFINHNNLTGNLPEWFGKHPDLFNIYIDNNQLSGCYHPNMASLCNGYSDTNERISNENNFDASWDEFCDDASGICDIGVEVILDCTDMEACNYNAAANYENSTCIYYDVKLDCPCGTVPGCTDPDAVNYDALADCDNGFCEYENKLLPGEYNIKPCLSYPLFTDLKITCPNATFTVTENTLDATITIKEDGDLKLSRSSNAEGFVKITLANSNGCNSEWIFNILKSDPAGCENSESDNLIFSIPWLSNFVNPLNCNNDTITIYTIFEIGPADGPVPPAVYIKNSEGGTLYTYGGKFLCSDYTGGEAACFDFYPLTNPYNDDNSYNIEDRWICPGNMLIPGCTDPTACNYNANAQTNDGSCEFGNTVCANPCNAIVGCTDVTANNYNATANCDDGSCEYDNNTIVFSTYPWLSSYVNQNSCNGESIIIYDAGYYNFILIQNESEGKLFLDNGTYYCDETAAYSCVNAYGLTSITESWTCENNTIISGCTNSNATNYNPEATVDDGSCQYDGSTVFTSYPWLNTYVNQSACNGESITIYDAGYYDFILIQNENERKLYLENGTYYCDETPDYSCVNAYGLTDVANTWACENNTTVYGCTDSNATNYNPSANTDDGSCEFEESNTNTVFVNYPWLNSIVNENNCGSESITVYDTGFHNFIYVQTAAGNSLYYQDGTFYCKDAPGYSCVNQYSLNDVVNTWNCGVAGITANRFITICSGDEIELRGKPVNCFCNPPVLDSGLAPDYYSIYIGDNLIENTVSTFETYLISPEISTTYTLVSHLGPTSPGCICDNENTIVVHVEIDNNCGGSNNYKQVNDYTNSVLKTTTKTEGFKLYPNSTNGKVFLKTPFKQDEGFTIAVYNINGKLINTIDKKSQQAEQAIELDLHDLAKGMYIIELREGQQTTIEKLIIK